MGRRGAVQRARHDTGDRPTGVRTSAPAGAASGTPVAGHCALGVALAVWEALAFVFLTSMPQGQVGFPTISVLFDPLVESLPGRILFVGLWLICGLGLLDVTGRRR